MASSALVTHTKPVGKAVSKATSRSIPAFLSKLHAMVNDPSTDELIRWSEEGDSFFVPSPDRFGRELLPRFFKHSNFGSFVRQLNMYGFHKVPHLQQGVLKNDFEDSNELLEFSNANFTRSQPDLLCLIRRQKGKPDPQAVADGTLDLPTLLTDLAAIRKHQSALSSDLKDLETSNRALWEEAIQSRERHEKHSETINKILRFLATVFGGQVGAGETNSNLPNQNNREEEVTKGKEKEVIIPQMRSRLLLEDVKERRDARAKAREIEDEEDDDEMIEEIGADSPRASTSRYPAKPPLQRNLSSTNFTSSLGNSAPSTSHDSQYQLSPDVLSSLLSPSNSNPLAAFMQLQNNAGITSPPISQTQTPSFHSAYANHRILPAHQEALASLLPSLTPTPISVDYTKAISDHAEVLQEVQNEKADIDGRTTALENAIAKLMQGLPVETQNALGDDALTLDPSLMNGAAGEGLNGMADVDLDEFLAQYSNQDTNDYSHLFDSNSPMELPPSLPTVYPSKNSTSTFESLSGSSGTSSPRSSRDPTPVIGDDIDWVGPSLGGRKKRKSDVLEDVEGSRKSSRQRKPSLLE